jgi:uncharacterized protein YodC (DUF2158 family)
MNQFKVGDVVVLKSSPLKPKLTITKIIDQNVVCKWFDESVNYHTETFEIEAIHLYKQDDYIQPIYLG